MTELFIGTSGWSYNEWAGVFYPDSKTNKLSFYSKVYGTAEVDSSFYAFPSKGLVLGWARYTPEDFVFSVKLPQLLTHEKKLDLSKGVEADLVRFLGLLRPLIAAGKLGPVLIQLPPSYSFQPDFEKLKAFLEMSPEDVKFAVEFRHPSWLREETWSLLRSKNVANVVVDEPLLPPDTVVTADFAFIRWHGRGSRPWYNYRYSDRELDTWVPKVKEVTSRVKQTYGYFNNHFRGFAVENSLKMMEKLGVSTPQQEEVRTRATRFIDTGRNAGGEGSILEFVGKAKD
ncbi:MAG: DUF72 domain-containing protein [Nitrososphaerota archaeon]|nr:DUF72 domain-containing protein [Nitrososphaerota archaeon]MDG7024652.1 DUF72 domain-containing protein [Nitrososphaerota archaeon]